MALTNASPPMPVNCFSLPHEFKVSELAINYETSELPHCDGAIHLERVPARRGGIKVFVIIECEFKINFPGIPFAFVWKDGLFLASRLEELPAKNASTPFRYSIIAQGLASTQDLVKLLNL